MSLLWNEIQFLLADDETFSPHIGPHLETVERPWSYYDLQGVISDHYMAISMSY